MDLANGHREGETPANKWRDLQQMVDLETNMYTFQVDHIARFNDFIFIYNID